jgi:hypothetical protein
MMTPRRAYLAEEHSCHDKFPPQQETYLKAFLEGACAPARPVAYWPGLWL